MIYKQLARRAREVATGVQELDKDTVLLQLASWLDIADETTDKLVQALRGYMEMCAACYRLSSVSSEDCERCGAVRKVLGEIERRNSLTME